MRLLNGKHQSCMHYKFINVQQCLISICFLMSAKIYEINQLKIQPKTNDEKLKKDSNFT